MKTLRPATGRAGRPRGDRAAADREDAGGRVRRPLALDPPDVGGAAAGVFDKRASLKDRASRVLIRLDDGRELRLREFGTKQRAWAKLLPGDQVGRGRDGRERSARKPGPRRRWRSSRRRSTSRATSTRCCAIRKNNRRDRPLLGRRDPLGGATSGPSRKASELDDGRGRATTRGAARAGRRDRPLRGGPSAPDLPDKIPMPLKVHRREGEPCPRCGTTIEAVFFSEHQMNYCPKEQTGGRVLKDRRLSKLLK